MLINEKMKSRILEDAKTYIRFENNEVFRAEVENALEMEDWDSLYDRFYTSLSFGTAGMRGLIGGGTNRINTYMVRKVSEGLAEYLHRVEQSLPRQLLLYWLRMASRCISTILSIRFRCSPMLYVISRQPLES